MENPMKPLSKLMTAALAGAGLFPVLALPAAAGECPAAQMRAGVRTSGEMQPKDVTDTELNAIDLGDQIAGLDGRRLRLRKLVVQPGGVVPWHDHTDRPALIMTAEGEITEFRSDCAVGVVHKAGDVSKEVAGIKHWWKNEGKAPAVLFAADIKNDAPAAN
jgi:quercetin dioxygenase-like cupin family protein